MGKEKHTYTVGVSIGLTTITSKNFNINEVLGEADSACYWAKEQGRHRVCCYQASDMDLAARCYRMVRPEAVLTVAREKSARHGRRPKGGPGSPRRRKKWRKRQVRAVAPATAAIEHQWST